LTLALIRDGTWEWALFFHVTGALVLIGALALFVAATFGGLRRLAFRTMLFAVIPSFILMRGSAEWVRSEDPFQDELDWLTIGYLISDAGVIVVIALAVLAWLSSRRGAGIAARIQAVLGPAYLVALLVAVWAMTTKPS
jgi:hypothetical protein